MPGSITRPPEIDDLRRIIQALGLRRRAGVDDHAVLHAQRLHTVSLGYHRIDSAVLEQQVNSFSHVFPFQNENNYLSKILTFGEFVCNNILKINHQSFRV